MAPLARIDQYVKSAIFSPDLGRIARAFCQDYIAVTAKSGTSAAQVIEVLTQLIELAAQQLQSPYAFECIHHKIRTPFDYTTFGLNLIGPLVDRAHSSLIGEAHLTTLEQQLMRGDSCILLSNHQTEADPQIMQLLLTPRHPTLANIYSVAGDRVTTDPLAVPLSLGTNLVCIFSKRHIDHPPEQKEAKRQHNRRAMKELGALLAKGGCCVWVAPSGGRDRADAAGRVEVAPFDPASVEMFHLLAKQTPRPVHFYPLALATHQLLPPPRSIQQEIGEERQINRAAVHLAFGPELDLSALGGADDKKEQRRLRAEAVWNTVKALYPNASSSASATLDT